MFAQTLRILDEMMPPSLIGDMTDEELLQAIDDQNFYLDSLMNPWSKVYNPSNYPLTELHTSAMREHLAELADARDYLDYLHKAFNKRKMS